jgi:hypothetical protein
LQSAGTHSILTHLGGLPALFRQSKKKARSGYFGPFPSLPSRTIPFQEKEPDPKKKDFIQDAGKVNLHKASPHIAISGSTPNPHTWISILLAVKQSPPPKKMGSKDTQHNKTWQHNCHKYQADKLLRRALSIFYRIGLFLFCQILGATQLREFDLSFPRMGD